MDVSRVREAWGPKLPALLTTHRSLRALASGFAPLLLLYALYTLLRWTFVERASMVGDHNAQSVMHFERRFGIDWEQWIQSQVMHHEVSIWFVNHYYVYAFFPVLVSAAVIAAMRAPAIFQKWRNVFVVSLGMALVGFAFFPLTPPRLLGSDSGFTDTLMLKGPQYYGDESGSSLFNLYGSIPSMVNEYAAMPSMHVGWSAVAAALFIVAFPGRRWVKALAAAHVAMMQLAVVATGNHYLIDGLIGLLVVGVSWIVVNRLYQHIESWWTLEQRSQDDFSVCRKS